MSGILKLGSTTLGTENNGKIDLTNVGESEYSSTNHTWTLKAVDAPIVGTNYSTNDDANSGQLAIYNGATKVWGITESGWLQQPNIPAFSAYGRRTEDGGSGNGTYAGGATVLFNEAVRYNIGNCYNLSTSVFTAPTNGIYFFSATCFNNSSGTKRVALIDSSGKRFVGQGQADSSNDFNINGTTYLNAGDYVYVIISYSDTIIYHADGHNEFNGYLIG